jgi:hypothetical protein
MGAENARISVNRFAAAASRAPARGTLRKKFGSNFIQGGGARYDSALKNSA